MKAQGDIASYHPETNLRMCRYQDILRLWAIKQIVFKRPAGRDRFIRPKPSEFKIPKRKPKVPFCRGGETQLRGRIERSRTAAGTIKAVGAPYELEVFSSVVAIIIYNGHSLTLPSPSTLVNQAASLTSRVHQCTS